MWFHCIHGGPAELMTVSGETICHWEWTVLEHFSIKHFYIVFFSVNLSMAVFGRHFPLSFHRRCNLGIMSGHAGLMVGFLRLPSTAPYATFTNFKHRLSWCPQLYVHEHTKSACWAETLSRCGHSSHSKLNYSVCLSVISQTTLYSFT